jgi:hypothetical protein
VLGAIAAVVAVAIGGVIIFNGDDAERTDAPSAVAVGGEAPAHEEPPPADSAVEPESAEGPVVTPSAVQAQTGTDARAATDGNDGEGSTSGADAESPPPAVRPQTGRKRKGAKARPRAVASTPETDPQVLARLSRRVRRQCGAGQRGAQLELEFLVDGTSAKMVRATKNEATSDVAACARGLILAASFPDGALRRKTLRVTL